VIGDREKSVIPAPASAGVNSGGNLPPSVIPAEAGIQECRMKQYYTYILAKRIYEHKQNLIDGFTKKYNVHTLVYYEVHNDIPEAITREKQIKKWNRRWKIRLIEEMNSEWNDLYYEIV